MSAATKSRVIEAAAAAAAARARIDEGEVVQPRRSLVSLALAVVVVIAVVWGGIRLFGTNPTPEPAMAASNANRSGAPVAGESTSAPTTPDASRREASTVPPGSAKAPANAKSVHSSALGMRAPAGTKASALAKATASPTGTSPAAVHEVIPDVPQRALQTIHGTVRVSIRVLVEQDGTVFAALTEQRGPSRYFERLAIEAAKQWTFPPADTTAQRLMLVKFGFTRDGASAEAVPVM